MLVSFAGSVRGAGTGRGFRGAGACCSVVGLGGGGAGAGLFPGLGGGGLTAGLGLSATGIVFASCCCLSLCFNQAGLLSSVEEGAGLSVCPVPLGIDGVGFDGTGGGVRGLVTSPSSACALRLTQGGGASSFTSAPPSSVKGLRGGSLGVLRSWLAQGARCELSSSFFSLILVSRFIMAELLPDLSRAFFMISDMSIPPPPPPPPPSFDFVGGGAFPCFPGLSVVDLTGLSSFGELFGGRVSPLEVIAVPGDRVGRGGASNAPALWEGLEMEGMGADGRGGGDMGMSL